MWQARGTLQLQAILVCMVMAGCAGGMKLGQYPSHLLDDRAALEVTGPIQSLSLSRRQWHDTQQVWLQQERVREVQFNHQGFTLEDIHFSQTGDEIRRIQFEAGFPTSFEHLKAGRRSASYRFEYNDKGDLTAQRAEQKLSYLGNATYQYGEDWIMRRSVVPHRPQQRRTEFTKLDKYQKMIEYVVTEQSIASIKDLENIVPERRETFIRDDNGQITKHETYSSGKARYLETFSYTSDGHISQSNVYKYTGGVAQQDYRVMYLDYELDEQQNWIQRTFIEEEKRGQFWYQRKKVMEQRRLAYYFSN